MTAEQFVYWLQGYAEMGGTAPTPEQWAMIKAHLALVFSRQVKVTMPSTDEDRGTPIPFNTWPPSTPATPAPWGGKMEIIC